jgi:hypothetical protein
MKEGARIASDVFPCSWLRKLKLLLQRAFRLDEVTLNASTSRIAMSASASRLRFDRSSKTARQM